MSVLSVVVPIYNVEDYLDACLASLARQEFTDLDVVMVDDGSTDRSAEIAESYARRDDRFKLVTRPNGGLSAARNTGIEHATGDLLAFVDSDDVVPPDAYGRLTGALEETGSDFATGNVLRLTNAGTSPARFLAETFKETRLKTHITRFRPLLADRIAWNKVFRRPFWDAHGLRFPEGRLNEDIPVILPLHFSAKSVDVISEPVYHWRQRESGGLSITERRLEKRALLNRIQAVTDVHDYLAEHGPRKARRWYDESLVADDLKYYLNVLGRADDEYRELFLDRVNALLSRADDRIYDKLAAIERLKWHLVRRRLMPELIEVLQFQRDGLAERRPVRVGRHWEGDYPFRGDPRLSIPSSVYRVDREMHVVAHIDAMRLEGGKLRIDGTASIEGIDAAAPGDQRVGLVLLRSRRLRRLAYLVDAVRFDTRGVDRPDANALGRQKLADVAGSGFTATLDTGRLRRFGRWQPGRLELYAVVRAGLLRRARSTFGFSGFDSPSAVRLAAPPDVLARAVFSNRKLELRVSTRWAEVVERRVVEDALELTIRAHGAPPRWVETAHPGSTRRRRFELEAPAGAPSTQRVRIPTGELLEELERIRTLAGEDEESVTTNAWLELRAGGGGPVPLVRSAATRGDDDALIRTGGRELALAESRQGEAALVLRRPRAVLGAAAWEDGTLRLTDVRTSEPAAEVVLFSRGRLAGHAFPARPDADGRLEAAPTPAGIPSLGGSLPLPAGHWRLCLRRAPGDPLSELVPLAAGPELAAQLPLRSRVDHKVFALVTDVNGHAVLDVERDLDPDERGPYQQRGLRRAVYGAGRQAPLRDAVVYTSFRGRQCSDSPRAILEELVRRGDALEHFWVVNDGACRVPDGVRVLREGSREHYETLARARYFVTNDHFPEWFERREDQICVQTWHGTPLKRLGFDVSNLRGGERRFERAWSRQLRNWQYVVSPNRFSTPILRRAYELEPEEMLETGYPRNDVLAAPDRERRTRQLRERLGLPADARVVLYAPTYRDNVRDQRGRYRLDFRLDVDRLRDALGPDAVLLVRKHHYVVDEIPTRADGFVRDVSSYPDGTELLLAADVLITDYSSMSVDFANTGRPILTFAYDLDAYREEIRGFYVDLPEVVPGPTLRTSDEVAEALQDLDAVSAAHAGRYAEFVHRFCELDDGGAAARVVDRVFGG